VHCPAGAEVQLGGPESGTTKLQRGRESVGTAGQDFAPPIPAPLRRSRSVPAAGPGRGPVGRGEMVLAAGEPDSISRSPQEALANVAGVIEAQALTKRYGDKTAVDEVSFTIRPGMVTGLLDPNGAGKSTTLRMVVGLEESS